MFTISPLLFSQIVIKDSVKITPTLRLIKNLNQSSSTEPPASCVVTNWTLNFNALACLPNPTIVYSINGINDTLMKCSAGWSGAGLGG